MGINPASVTSHDNYCDKKGFNFPILSDPERTVAAMYGALKSNGKSIQRTVYVVGPDSRIVFAEKGMPSDDKILEAIAEAS